MHNKTSYIHLALGIPPLLLTGTYTLDSSAICIMGILSDSGTIMASYGADYRDAILAP